MMVVMLFTIYTKSISIFFVYSRIHGRLKIYKLAEITGIGVTHSSYTSIKKAFQFLFNWVRISC